LWLLIVFCVLGGALALGRFSFFRGSLRRLSGLLVGFRLLVPRAALRFLVLLGLAVFRHGPDSSLAATGVSHRGLDGCPPIRGRSHRKPAGPADAVVDAHRGGTDGERAVEVAHADHELRPAHDVPGSVAREGFLARGAEARLPVEPDPDEAVQIASETQPRLG